MKRAAIRVWLACLAVQAVALEGTASAHRPSESHLTFRPSPRGTEARLEVALRDLDWVLAVDANGDGAVTWAEVTARSQAIERYAFDGIHVSGVNGQCPISAGTQQLIEHSDGAYLSMPLGFACATDAGTLTLSYGLLFDVDPQHRALVRIDDGSDKAFVLSKASPTATFTLSGQGVKANANSIVTVITAFIRHGFDHIAAGFDHLLFLLLLLLPSVLRRQGAEWLPMASLKPTLAEVAKVVTAFTAAHAISMSAAALGLVSLPANLVEPAIALSLVIAAANNVWPLFAGGRWALPFALGLLHGFGFSSALADLGLPTNRLVPALVGFNMGVELGQFVLVALVVPVAFLLRRKHGYRSFAITGGSMAIAAVALFWFVERLTRAFT